MSSCFRGPREGKRNSPILLTKKAHHVDGTLLTNLKGSCVIMPAAAVPPSFGANLTGITNLAAELVPKRLQLLRELLPNAARFGVLRDPPVAQSVIADQQAAARTLGMQLVFVNARTDSDLETAFSTFSQQRVGAVLVGLSSFYDRRTEQLAALAARHALPAMFPYREYALAGGLMSYGSSFG
jgi:putative ABC transport system substrate-binding protein